MKQKLVITVKLFDILVTLACLEKTKKAAVLRMIELTSYSPFELARLYSEHKKLDKYSCSFKPGDEFVRYILAG